jgi:hypothetical protein
MASPTNSSSSPSLTTLPGELRNVIFNLCINHALSHPKVPASLPLTVSISPRRRGPEHLTLSNIGPLPLLLVNKQLFAEVSSLIYARAEHVSFGPGISQFLDDDPVERWVAAYSLLEARPDIQRLAKSITISLPRTPNFEHLKIYASLRKLPVPDPAYSFSLPILRSESFSSFLQRFESLENVTVKMVNVVDDGPPKYEGFLGLWRIFGGRLRLEMKYEVSYGTWEWARGPIFQDWNGWQEGWRSYVKELEQKNGSSEEV